MTKRGEGLSIIVFFPWGRLSTSHARAYSRSLDNLSMTWTSNPSPFPLPFHTSTNPTLIIASMMIYLAIHILQVPNTGPTIVIVISITRSLCL